MQSPRRYREHDGSRGASSRVGNVAGNAAMQAQYDGSSGWQDESAVVAEPEPALVKETVETATGLNLDIKW